MSEDFQVDLSNCEKEPIHIPGAIQPHGVLIACRGTPPTIQQVSRTVEAAFRVEAESLAGAPLTKLLSDDSVVRLQSALGTMVLRESNPIPVYGLAGQAFDAVLHRPPNSDGVVILELEVRQPDALAFHPRLRTSVTRLQSVQDIVSLSQVAAEEVRALTGFDRVMVYRFDRDWHGHVIAEARRDDLEPFLGLHYPASDIPPQARRLYTLNWLRLIADIGYTPSPLVPALDPVSGKPLDLSFSVLRSVSPIHVEYLQNMGVTASMSISLLRDGQLWGLIACHHYTGPKLVGFSLRETVEYLGQTLSWHVGVRETVTETEQALTAQRYESAIVEQMATTPNFLEGLVTPPLLQLTSAEGVAVVYEQQIVRRGTTLDDEAMRSLVGWLRDASDEVTATDHLAARWPESAHWEAVSTGQVAGVLAMPISREHGDYVLWFRPATERVVDWAGDPHKTATLRDGAPRLSPRGSFALWRETVRGQSLPWEPWALKAAANLRRVVLGGVRKRAAELRVLTEKLLAADRAKDEFLATVSHELRTPLNAILGWSRLLRAGSLAEDKRAGAITTIERNAKAQSQIIDDMLDVSSIITGKMRLQITNVEMPAVIDAALETVRPAAEAKSVRLQVLIDPDAGSTLGDANRLQQVVWNLLSNAVKFTPKGGRVHVRLQRLDSAVEITVADTGSGIEAEALPRVFERFWQSDGSITRRQGGLGLGLAIVRHLVELHGGTVSAESEGLGKGSTFTVRIPIAPLQGGRTSAPTAPASEPDIDCPANIKDLRVVVVDDEEDARELLRTVLEDCGAVVTVCRNAAEAYAEVRTDTHDVLVSDIGMPDEDGYALIRKVRALPSANGGRIPAVALTAYATVGDRTRALSTGYNAHVAKPVEMNELLAVIASVAGRYSEP